MDGDDIELIILFESEQEMEGWLKNKANLQELRRQYAPRNHRCLFCKERRQLTVLKGKS